MASSVDRLLQLKEEIAQAKLDSASIKGALDQSTKQFKDEFQCRTIESAKLKLEKLKEKKEELQGDVDDIVEELEAHYEW